MMNKIQQTDDYYMYVSKQKYGNVFGIYQIMKN